MTDIQGWVLLGYAGIVATWVIRIGVVQVIQGRLKAWTLTLGSPRANASSGQAIAVIPAKDEEATLGACLESVLAQTYSGLTQIVVVDDRSTDRTGEVARRFAARDRRVRVITIDTLPPDWTGKNHAIHRGIVEGLTPETDWLWLIDSDTHHAPDSLAILLKAAEDHRADLTSLIPRMRCESFWERVLQPLAGVVLMRSFSPIRVNAEDPARALPFANGQVMLFRREAYQAVGGHEAVRHRLLEDIALAKRMHAQGRRVRLAMSTEISSTRMYSSLAQLIRGWSRIYYDGLQQSVAKMIYKILEPLIFSQTNQVAFLAVAVLLLNGWPVVGFAGLLLGLAVIHTWLMQVVIAQMYRISSPDARSSRWYWLGGWMMNVIYLRTILLCFTGEVTWRGTTYRPPSAPLASVERPDGRTLHPQLPRRALDSHEHRCLARDA